MHVFSHAEFDDHDQVLFCSSPGGLRAIIAIHDTTLGPAAGGCRFWRYENEDEALTDALRLSRAMSYKNALAGLPLGGGKSVVMAPDDPAIKSNVLLEFADHVQRLGGRYWTAEDVGVGPDEVELLAKVTDYVFGRPGHAGDPSPATARGVFAGIRSAVRHHLDGEIGGLRVALQGVGNVGLSLGRLLREAGAQLMVADVVPHKVERAVAELDAKAVDVDELHRVEADVFAPCALGGSLNARTIAELGAQVVAGSANNQLADRAAGIALHERGVLYAPDYVVNAGGMLWASGEIFGSDWDADRVLERIDRIEESCDEIFSHSAREDRPPSEIADQMARDMLATAP